MRPDSTDSAGGGDLLVPMAWMYAEYVADELLRTGDLMPPTTLEYRAGRHALALTIFLSGSPAGGPRSGARMAEWHSLTAYGTSWPEWVCARLDRLEALAFEAGGTVRDPDLELAGAAWRWLEETEMLAPDLDAMGPTREAPCPAAEEEGPKVWTPAWQLGLPLGHLAIHLF
ncbi:hypothetical protein [Streptomyces sp. NRRL F-5135]|uniref:hypothetical protein n=1 Tax=Streptomyces sp. NRRL F-5135 TaxID=1463858 RepID=UPI0004C9F904|nr:hypothetical protein [Streptomyces sp. NRRL F-5135]